VHPASPTPIIIQQILRDRNGAPRHRFAWSCPNCGKAWPKFLPVTAVSVQRLKFPSPPPRVFFVDRLSRAAVDLAKTWSRGALIVFEPSARCDEKLWAEALRLTHILKYSRDRHTPLDEALRQGSSVHLEIQTLGADGFRFRSRLPRARTRDWVHLAALRAPHVADTCGAGDWCTAGLLDRIGRLGRRGLTSLRTSKLESALKYGQALAARNCGFEGARGGMYEVDHRAFDAQIGRIQTGEHMEPARRRVVRPEASLTSTICPSCSSRVERAVLDRHAESGRRFAGIRSCCSVQSGNSPAMGSCGALRDSGGTLPCLSVLFCARRSQRPSSTQFSINSSLTESGSYKTGSQPRLALTPPGRPSAHGSPAPQSDSRRRGGENRHRVASSS
jgi:hypothetical protein